MSEFVELPELADVLPPRVQTGVPAGVQQLRSVAGDAAMAVVEDTEGEDADIAVLLGIPSEYRVRVNGTQHGRNGATTGVDLTVTIPDRATQPGTKSIGGDLSLSLHWDVGAATVSVQGATMPLSQLQDALARYDRSVNWSAIQGLDF